MLKTIQELQLNVVKDILAFNAPHAQKMCEVEWKLLVYDISAQDIISPLLSVKQLRDSGVTLHLAMHSARYHIPDTPVIYLCLPTPDNVSRIKQDMCEGLYHTYHLNFTRCVSRQVIEELAQASIQYGCVSSVKSIYDQYINFICLERDLFCLKNHNSECISYYELNRGAVHEEEMHALIETIVDGLFAVCVTVGTVPVIRAPRGTAAEMVAERLDARLRDSLRDVNGCLFNSASMAFNRPLLVLFDRNLDLSTPLHHTWSYQGLVHDVLEMRMNRVTLPEQTADRAPKSVELSQTDEFWSRHRGSPFPEVAEAIQQDLEKYKAAEDEIKSLQTHMGSGSSAPVGNSRTSAADLGDDFGDSFDDSLSDNTTRLTTAMSTLPELMERKRCIDSHTSLATVILEHIKQRHLDVFFEHEEKLLATSGLSSGTIDRAALTQCLRDHGTAEDALRLYLMHLISGKMSPADEEECFCVLRDRDADLSCLNYIKRWRMHHFGGDMRQKVTSGANTVSGGSRSSNQSPSDGSVYSLKTSASASMLSKWVSHGSQLVLDGVRNLVVKNHYLPITRTVEALMDQKSLPANSPDMLTYDPRLLLPSSSASQHLESRQSATASGGLFRHAIVFVVGPGNYMEYKNLQDYSKAKTGVTNRKTIVYGCTDMQTPTQFLAQLSKLGMEI